jgi:uncharacterized membrane protein
MNKIKKLMFSVFPLSFIYCISCTKAKEVKENTSIANNLEVQTENIPSAADKLTSGWNVKYSTHIKPLIQAKCLTGGCHTTAGTATGYLTTYNEVILKVDTPMGNGALKKSILGYPGTPMPPSGSQKLTKSELLQFIYWLNNGAPNN